MAVFVDLDEEAEPPQAHHYGLKPEWNGERATQPPAGKNGSDGGQSRPTARDREPENLNEHNGMAEALGCYP